MTEWPAWHPTPGEISRLGVPTFVAPGPDNPMGSRALYLYSGGKDTLFRIHGTNQPADGNQVNIPGPAGGDEFRKLSEVTGFQGQRRSSRKFRLHA
jgi:hypothetical protein